MLLQFFLRDIKSICVANLVVYVSIISDDREREIFNLHFSHPVFFFAYISLCCVEKANGGWKSFSIHIYSREREKDFASHSTVALLRFISTKRAYIYRHKMFCFHTHFAQYKNQTKNITYICFFNWTNIVFFFLHGNRMEFNIINNKFSRISRQIEFILWHLYLSSRTHATTRYFHKKKKVNNKTMKQQRHQ